MWEYTLISGHTLQEKEAEHPALQLLFMWFLFMASLPDGTLKEGD